MHHIPSAPRKRSCRASLGPAASPSGPEPFCSVFALANTLHNPGRKQPMPGSWCRVCLALWVCAETRRPPQTPASTPRPPRRLQPPQFMAGPCAGGAARGDPGSSSGDTRAERTRRESKHLPHVWGLVFSPLFFSFSPQKAVPAAPGRLRQHHGRLSGDVSEAGEDRGGHLRRGVQGSVQAHGAAGGH